MNDRFNSLGNEELIRLVRQGDGEAREYLASSNIGVVKKLVKGFLRKNPPLKLFREDLVGYGLLRLSEVIDENSSQYSFLDRLDYNIGYGLMDEKRRIMGRRSKRKYFFMTFSADMDGFASKSSQGNILTLENIMDAWALVNNLPPYRRKLVIDHYGLSEGSKEMTLGDLARKYRISCDAIARELNMSLKVMRSLN